VHQPARNVTAGAHEFFGRRYRAPVWDSAGRVVYLVGTSGLWRVQLGADGQPDILSRVIAVPGSELSSVVTTPEHNRYWTTDGGQSLVVLTRDTASFVAGLYRVDLTHGTATPWYSASQEIDDPWISKARIVGSPVRNRLVLVAEDLQHPAEVWTASAWDQPRQLTKLNASIGVGSLPGGRMIKWQDSSGRTLRGVIMLPGGYAEGRRYPLVVFQFPGEHKSERVNHFGGDDAAGLMNMHLLTTRGYAVLLPDVPSGGADTTLLGATWRAIGGGVDRAVALGIADSARLGIVGHSFGAYGVLGVIIATPRFRAAVALSGGYYDFPAQVLQLQSDGGVIYTKTGVYQLGGSLWERPSAYVANSPVFFLDRVTTPLLLVNGDADPYTLPTQSAQVFVGLRALGRKVEYAIYPGEGHNYLSWTRSHQEDVVNRILEWFDRHLKAPQQPE